MSERIDVDEQQSYQNPYVYQSALYQGHAAHPAHRPGLFGLVADQPGTGMSTSPRHRLIVAICSLFALLAVVVILLASLQRDASVFLILAALVALGLVCATIVAINVAFQLRR
jgi:hypothetical protein